MSYQTKSIVFDGTQGAFLVMHLYYKETRVAKSDFC